MFNILTNLGDFYLNGQDGIRLGDTDYWRLIVVIAALMIALLVGNLLIQVIKPLKKALIPSPVLGGFLLLAFMNIMDACGVTIFSRTVLDMITYHFLGIGFIAGALKKKSAADKETAKKNAKATMDSSFITVSGYLVQAVVGLTISIILFFAIGSFPASGVLVPMGFGQGPGQALNWGTIYETEDALQFGRFVDGANFGKSVAALGFIAASIGGIVYLNIERRKGNIKMTSRAGDYVETNSLDTYEGANEIETSGVIDKLSVQIGLVLACYFVTYLLILLVTTLVPVDLVYNTLWGFNFLVGTGVAAIVVALFNLFEKKGIMKKSYINNFQMDRIAGFSFDIMTVAAIGSIDLRSFANVEFVLPLVLMFVLCTLATYFLVKAQCYHLFKKDGYAEESFLAMFGMLTGTASTGVILLRQIDPNFKTQAYSNLIFQALWAVVFGAPVLLLMNGCNDGWWGDKGLSFGAAGSLIIFAVYLVIMVVVVYRDKVFKKKAQKAE